MTRIAQWATSYQILPVLEAGTVGEHPYTHPVVQANAWYLWPLEGDWCRRYPDPWGCRPYYCDPRYHCNAMSDYGAVAPDPTYDLIIPDPICGLKK